MITEIAQENWVIGNCSTKLKQIHLSDKNIAVYNREIDFLSEEINSLLQQNIELRASGNVRSITKAISKELSPLHLPLLLRDVEQLLSLFDQVSNAKIFRFLLATINTNMCRRFHTDMNDLRMLCTYSGPGTLWLSEDNINRNALNSCGDNECIVLDESKIQHAKTGAAVILKGAIYPEEGTKAIVHRSPTIEEYGGKRLLLRIDTNEFLNFH